MPKRVELCKVKKGEFFRLTDSESAPVWVRDDYDKSYKMYDVYKYDDVNHCKQMKGSRLVYIGFTF